MFRFRAIGFGVSVQGAPTRYTDAVVGGSWGAGEGGTHTNKPPGWILSILPRRRAIGVLRVHPKP